jgi:transglutaminase-like putative cysteine protease
MRIQISHDTVYRYDQPVRTLTQLLRLTPRDHDGQHVLRWRIEPSVDGRLRQREDAFGNILHVFSSDGPVEAITLKVTGEVDTSETHGVVRGCVERLPDMMYLRESDLAAADAVIREFARDETAPAGDDPLAAMHRLLEAVHREMAFDTAPTASTTTAAEAFAMRKGVCQDLTHVFIAAARHLEVPARYVSGYFHRADGVVQQEAGHAWAEARIPDLGWVGFDPANGISAGEAHVRVAHGLDYLSAAPVRGTRTGGGHETLKVSLAVRTPSQGQSQSQGPGQSQSQSAGAGRSQSQG